MAWTTYILECADGSYYVGYTGDLAARIQIHESGQGPDFTALRLPVRLVHTENHENLQAAVARERQLKGWSRAKKEALISGNLTRLRALSRRRQSSTIIPPPGAA